MKDIKLPIITRKIINETVLPSKVLEFHKKVHTGICIEAWTVFYLLRNHINPKYKKQLIKAIVNACDSQNIYQKFDESILNYCFYMKNGFEASEFRTHLTNIHFWKSTDTFWNNCEKDFWINKKIQKKLK